MQEKDNTHTQKNYDLANTLSGINANFGEFNGAKAYDGMNYGLNARLGGINFNNTLSNIPFMKSVVDTGTNSLNSDVFLGDSLDLKIQDNYEKMFLSSLKTDFLGIENKIQTKNQLFRNTEEPKIVVPKLDFVEKRCLNDLIGEVKANNTEKTRHISYRTNSPIYTNGVVPMSNQTSDDTQGLANTLKNENLAISRRFSENRDYSDLIMSIGKQNVQNPYDTALGSLNRVNARHTGFINMSPSSGGEFLNNSAEIDENFPLARLPLSKNKSNDPVLNKTAQEQHSPINGGLNQRKRGFLESNLLENVILNTQKGIHHDINDFKLNQSVSQTQPPHNELNYFVSNNLALPLNNNNSINLGVLKNNNVGISKPYTDYRPFPQNLSCYNTSANLNELSLSLQNISRIGNHSSSLARPFKCNTCEQSFSRNHDLKRHVKIHTGIKPYKCKRCGKNFGRSDALKRHSSVKRCKNLELKNKDAKKDVEVATDGKDSKKVKTSDEPRSTSDIELQSVQREDITNISYINNSVDQIGEDVLYFNGEKIELVSPESIKMVLSRLGDGNESQGINS